MSTSCAKNDNHFKGVLLELSKIEGHFNGILKDTLIARNILFPIIEDRRDPHNIQDTHNHLPPGRSTQVLALIFQELEAH